MKKVAIVGGGISGLLSAFFLVKKGYEVTVLEKARFGGKLQTYSSPLGLMEAAANGILADRLVEEVCAEAGIELIPTLKHSRARYIFTDGKPKRWPLGFSDTLRLASFLLKKPWRNGERLRGKILSDWLRNHFSKNAVDSFFTPACQGIFGVGADRLSAALIMQYFFNKKKTPRGKLRGTVSARGGMKEIVDKLVVHLRCQGVRFHTEDVTELSGLLRDFQEIVIATDIVAGAELLESIKDFRGTVLKTVPTVDLVSINAFFADAESPVPGFGILFPRDEGVEALGVLQNTYIFPKRGSEGLSETWIYRTSETSDERLKETMLKDRKRALGLESAVKEFRANRWPQALPLYGLELESVLDNMPPGHPRVHLIGNYLGEIGLNRIFSRASRLLE